ncbi:MAG: hypothetical protein Q8R72_15865 [Hylemonella sp.]|nr:hypothetical protein [Hylemonella sp.]
MMSLQLVSTQDLDVCRDLQAEALLVMPCTDVPMALRAATLMAQRAGAPGHVLLVEDHDGWGFIRIVNLVFRRTHGRYFGYVAQDAFAGRLWLTLALDALQRPGKHLFAFNDGKWHGAFAGFGLAERDWASHNYTDGNFFHPGYQRHYADVELSLLAISQGAYIHDPRSLLVEVDWAKDKAHVDAQDRALYQARVATGFEGRVMSPELLQMVA